MELATRFIALATVGNEAKAKYVYALNIAPVDKMRLMDLIQKTTDETPCPYDSINLMKDIVTKSEVIFFLCAKLRRCNTQQLHPIISISFLNASFMRLSSYFRAIQLSSSTIRIHSTMTATEIHTKREKDLDPTAIGSDKSTSSTKVILSRRHHYHSR